MTVSYTWQGISPLVVSVIILFIGFFVFTRFYTKNKKRPRAEKTQAEACGVFSLFMAVFYIIIEVASGVAIANPSTALVVGVSFLTLVLVYLDGRLTERAVGGGRAVEANPVMGFLFHWMGIRRTRYAVFVAVLAVVGYMAYARELLGISVACLLWVFVDSSNVLVMRKIERNERLRASVICAEWGFEDIHEL